MAKRAEPTVHIDVNRAQPVSLATAELPAAVTTGEAQPYADWLLQQLGEEGLTSTCDHADIQTVAAACGTGARVLLSNGAVQGGEELLLCIHTMTPGMKRLTVYRIDAARRWRGGKLMPMEVRETPDREGRHEQQLFLPAQSTALICIDPVFVRAQG